MSGVILVPSTPSDDTNTPDPSQLDSLPHDVVGYATSPRTPLNPSAMAQNNPGMDMICEQVPSSTSSPQSQNASTRFSPPILQLSPLHTNSDVSIRPSVNLVSSAAHKSRCINPVNRATPNAARNRRHNVRRDSFGDDESNSIQDEAAHYMDTSPIFNIPLSELAESTQEESKSSSVPRQTIDQYQLSQPDTGSDESVKEEYAFPPLNQYKSPVPTPTPDSDSRALSGSDTLSSSASQQHELAPTQILSSQDDFVPTQIISSADEFFPTQILHEEDELIPTQIINTLSGPSSTHVISDDGAPKNRAYIRLGHLRTTHHKLKQPSRTRPFLPYVGDVIQQRTDRISVSAVDHPSDRRVEFEPTQLIAQSPTSPSPTKKRRAMLPYAGHTLPQKAHRNNELGDDHTLNNSIDIESTQLLDSESTAQHQQKHARPVLPYAGHAVTRRLTTSKPAHDLDNGDGFEATQILDDLPISLSGINRKPTMLPYVGNVASRNMQRVLAPEPKQARAKSDDLREPKVVKEGSQLNLDALDYESSNSVLGMRSERSVIMQLTSNRLGESDAECSDQEGTEIIVSNDETDQEMDQELVGSISQLAVSSPSSEAADQSPVRAKRVKSSRVREQADRPTKRARTHSPSPSLQLTPSESVAADAGGTRVYALWSKSDGNYYSGRVIDLHKQQTEQYLIQFDDGEYAVVELGDMRSCQLQIGDRVSPLSGGRRTVAVVTQITTTDEDYLAIAEVDGSVLELRPDQLKMKRSWIDASWDNRRILATAVKYPEQVATTPRSPQKASRAVPLPHTRKARVGKGLLGTGFVISLSPAANDSDERKEQLASTLRELGATPIDDWAKLFTFEGRTVTANHYWKGNFTDVKYEGKKLDRVFLLADVETTKPRYLFALAFGIPCLQASCVDDFRDNGLDNWFKYVLPAGYSTHYTTQVSQRLMLNWASQTDTLTELLDDHMGTHIFRSKSVLFVDKHFVPERLGRNAAADQKRVAFSYLPKLVLAMGARLVEAVSDVKYASENKESYDFRFVTGDSAESRAPRDGLQYYTVGDLKELLISGRPLPEISV